MGNFISGIMFSTASWAGKSDQMNVNETAVTLSGVIVRKTHKHHFELKDRSGEMGIAWILTYAAR